MKPINLNADMLEVFRRLGKEKVVSPIYTYLCDQCGKCFDRIQTLRESVKTQFCEECGEQLEREVEKPGKFVRGAGSWSTPA